jgi:hypothetical protein
MVPDPGFFWTPGYWGWSNGVFVFNQGYWGPQVGFYGGINYGFGYVGVGYAGYWNNGAFLYNRSVNNVGSVTSVYNKTVIINNISVSHVSYNGGEGGITARPNHQEEAAAHARHIPPTSVQTSHVQAASTNRRLFESQNHGKPAIAAITKPGEFSGRNVVAAKAAAPSYKPATARTVSRTAANTTSAHPNTATHAKDISPSRPAAPNTSKAQSSQEENHVAQRKLSAPVKQPVEQKHTEPGQPAGEQQKLQERTRSAPATRSEAKPKEKN